jgi:predicted Zn-dependent protease
VKRGATFLLASLLMAMPCAAADDPPLTAGYAPDLKSVEAGLWLAAEQDEKDIQNSPLRLHDDAVDAYIKHIVCKLLPAQCETMRIYVVESPDFNANVRANGSVVVYTGLLLRLENEAQLAAVLGHEITHYLNRHQLKGTESARDIRNALAFFSLGMAGVGVGYRVDLSSVTNLAGWMAAGAYFSYSRGQETEADEGGLKLGIEAGYDPHQASIVWRDVEAEQEANPDRKARSAFSSSHPANLDRMNALARLADTNPDSAKATFIGAEEYRAVFSKFRAHWLDQDLNGAQYEQTLFVLNRLIVANPSDAVLRFYQGETYRRRNGKGDLQSAVKSYRDALALNDAPATVWRGLGLAALKSGDKSTAQEGFKHYLELAPQAEDRAMVELYLSNAEQ